MPQETRQYRRNIVAIRVRTFVRGDLSELVPMQGQRPGAWDDEGFRRRIDKPGTDAYVAERPNGHVVGFVVWREFKTRVHLLNFGVSRHWQRRGVGVQIFTKILSKLLTGRRLTMTANVPERLLTAQQFLRSLGFRCVGTQRRYCADGSDALRMQYSAELAAGANRITPFLDD